MSITERAARAYLTHLTEPQDRLAGEMVAAYGAAETVDRLWRGAAAAEVAGRTRPRFMSIYSPDKVEGWYAEQLALYPNVGIRFLIPSDLEWPAGLIDLGATAPHGLWVNSKDPDLGFLDDKPPVAIVGARAATSYGEHVARELASALTDRGYQIISGAAYGIDGTAHRAALAAGDRTVAFLAGGAEHAYPAGHAQLIDRIAEQGAVISENPPGSTPTKWRFLSRNRLIAAMGQATVVVEAGWRSGSLNTAGHAAGLGRPLGAVPGPITSAASAGCHRILREMGGVCITGADDVVSMLPVQERMPA